ncbi:HAD family hydrolase [Paenibacillus sp. MBLB4367]|uniref:HAD family hydrolase n=1 Tax=Paenibacillus sp. MBLB4367 TaxID=3384767 RepID=UPI0039081E3E
MRPDDNWLADDPELWKADACLRQLEARMDTIRLLSVDVFDTLLFRCCTHPNDLFVLTGVKAKQEGLLSRGTTPREFRAIRMAAEKEAWEANRSVVDEITLEDIYAHIPAHVCTNAKRALELELESERELCYVNPHMTSLIRFCKNRGIPVALVSDMYISPEQLGSLLEANGFEPGLLDALLVSSAEHGGKTQGHLYDALLESFPDIRAEEIVHIGDNRTADVDGAARKGIASLYYSIVPETLHSPLHWESVRHGDVLPALRSLRKLAAASVPEPYDEKEAFFYRFGAAVFGPFLQGFCHWVLDSCAAEGRTAIHPFMREAHLLGPMLERSAAMRGMKLRVAPLYVSRQATLLAAMSDFTAKELDKVLSLDGITLQELFQLLGLIPGEASDWMERQEPARGAATGPGGLNERGEGFARAAVWDEHVGGAMAEHGELSERGGRASAEQAESNEPVGETEAELNERGEGFARAAVWDEHIGGAVVDLGVLSERGGRALAEQAESNEQVGETLQGESAFSLFASFMTLPVSECGSIPFPATSSTQEAVSGTSLSVLEALKHFLLRDDTRVQIRRTISVQRRLLIEHIRQQNEGKSGKLLTVDIGFNGTIQAALQAALDLEGITRDAIHLMAVGTGKAAEHQQSGMDLRCFIGSEENADLAKRFVRSPGFMEELMMGDFGSTLGYEQCKDGRVVPVLAKLYHPPEEFRYKRACQEGVFAFQRYYGYLLDRKPSLIEAGSAREWSQTMHRPIDFPTPEEAEHLGGLTQQDNFGGVNLYPICAPLPQEWRGKGADFLLDMSNFGPKIWSVLWPQGTAARHEPYHTYRAFARLGDSFGSRILLFNVMNRLAENAIRKVHLFGTGAVADTLTHEAMLHDIRVRRVVDPVAMPSSAPRKPLEPVSLQEAAADNETHAYVIASLTDVAEYKTIILDWYARHRPDIVPQLFEPFA